MGTWGNLEKVSCGNPDVALALCPGVMASLPPQAPKVSVPETSTAATRDYNVCSQLFLT